MQAETINQDYSLHGILKIRMENAPTGDVAQLRTLMGFTPTEANDDLPAITFRFVDRLERSGPLRFLGLDDVAFDDEHFYLVGGHGTRQTLIRVPLDQIGKEMVIDCEKHITSELKGLMNPIVGLKLLNLGITSLHATAFNYEDQGVIVAGWSKSGKTETLLSFMENGGKFIGDEHVFLKDDLLLGVDRPVKLWEWHLDQLTKFSHGLTRTDRWRIRLFNLLIAVTKKMIDAEIGREGFLNRALRWLNTRQGARVTTTVLFGRNANDLRGKLRKLLWVVTWEKPETTVEAAQPDDIAKRIVHSHQHQRLLFLNFYLKFCFAFPDRANPLVDEAIQRETEVLSKLLEDCDAYIVHHPHPVSMDDLFEAIRQHM